jgi:hypothetical protein
MQMTKPLQAQADKKQSPTDGHDTQQAQTHEEDQDEGTNSPSEPLSPSEPAYQIHGAHCRHNKRHQMQEIKGQRPLRDPNPGQVTHLRTSLAAYVTDSMGGSLAPTQENQRCAHQRSKSESKDAERKGGTENG